VITRTEPPATVSKRRRPPRAVTATATARPCDMRISIIGCGDAFGSGGRFSSATLIEANEGTCLLDCGPSTMTALNGRRIDPDRVDVVILTHLHGDHFAGIPFFLLDAQWIRRRRRPLTILGPPGTRRRLHDTLEALFPSSTAQTPWSFAWTVEERQPGETSVQHGFTIRTMEVVHPSGAPATAVRLAAAGKVFAHSGDTEWTEVLLELAAGADLLFLECFAAVPMRTHLDYATLVARRAAFDAKRVVLTHLGPGMLAHLEAVDRALFEVAEDGLSFEL